MPTIVHPNEILDGALMFSYSAFTWFAQNHPVILELYRRHGKDLWFAGVVLTVAPAVVAEKERHAFLNARLAKEVLNADGIIATKIGGGAVDTDLMMTYTRAEEMGMKATLIIMERYPDTGITFVPENVNALVTPGSHARRDHAARRRSRHRRRYVALGQRESGQHQSRSCRPCRQIKKSRSGSAT